MADRYFINGGSNNNWSDTGNWSTTSGGAGGSSVPTSSDAVHLDGNSPNCVVNASGRVCQSLDCTGYTNTLTMTFNITSSGSVTLSSAMTIAGSGALAVNGTSTLTSNGKTWPNNLTHSTNATYTYADDWVVGGNYSLTVSMTLNGSKVSVLGNFSWLGMSMGTGTLIIEMVGSGTKTITGPSGGSFNNPLHLNNSAGDFEFTTHRMSFSLFSPIAFNSISASPATWNVFDNQGGGTRRHFGGNFQRAS